MNLGMISTRFNGLDGVSLESAKVATVLRQQGHDVAWFAGELGESFQPGMVHGRAHFDTPANRRLEAACFGTSTRSPGTTRALREATEDLKTALRDFLDAFEIDVVIAQNVLCLPMQLPLGLALTEVLAETGLPVIGHHHDFSWERERFKVNAVPDILGAAFPPVLPRMRHVVIQSTAAAELRRRRGAESTVVPNVMDFETGPDRLGDPRAFRALAGVADDDIVLLQPTRVIPRKGIEMTIDLAAELADPRIKVIITHQDGDEGHEYGRSLREKADRLGVDLRNAPVRHFSADPGQPTLADAYAAADLVCFPSLYEGFGNALLETFFYRRPVFVNRYLPYVTDIAPTGVQCIEVNGAVHPDAVKEVVRLLEDPSRADEAVARNYEIATEHFSFKVLRERYAPLVSEVAAVKV